MDGFVIKQKKIKILKIPDVRFQMLDVKVKSVLLNYTPCMTPRTIEYPNQSPNPVDYQYASVSD